MKKAEYSFPRKSIVIVPKLPPQISALPFYVKEVGLVNSRKLVRGVQNNFSEYIITYVFSSVSYIKNKQKTMLVKDDMVFSACNSPLTFVQQSKDYHFYLIFSGPNAQFFYNYSRNRTGVFHANPLSDLPGFFYALLNLDYEKNPMEAQYEASLLIHQLLFEMYKISRSQIEAKKLTPVQDSAVLSAIRFIEENYSHNITLDDICNSVSFSKYYFCKLFKEHTGVTIHQYVTQYRVNKSKELLSYSKLSISAVASSVGFSSSLTFGRQFKEYVHMTPSEFREHY